MIQPADPDTGCPDCALYLAAIHGLLAEWQPGSRPPPLAAQLGAALDMYSEHLDQHRS